MAWQSFERDKNRSMNMGNNNQSAQHYGHGRDEQYKGRDRDRNREKDKERTRERERTQWGSSDYGRSLYGSDPYGQERYDLYSEDEDRYRDKGSDRNRDREREQERDWDRYRFDYGNSQRENRFDDWGSVGGRYQNREGMGQDNYSARDWFGTERGHLSQSGQSGQSRQYNQYTPYGPYQGRGPKNYRRSDDRIKEEVCEVLTWNADIDASNIEIDVAEGIVTLKGDIDDRKTRRMAEEVVENISGVQDVKNELKVKSFYSSSNNGTSGSIIGANGTSASTSSTSSTSSN